MLWFVLISTINCIVSKDPISIQNNHLLTDCAGEPASLLVDTASLCYYVLCCVYYQYGAREEVQSLITQGPHSTFGLLDCQLPKGRLSATDVLFVHQALIECPHQLRLQL